MKRKRIFLTLLALLVTTAGCQRSRESTDDTPTPSPSVTPEDPQITDLPDNEDQEVIWAHTPDLPIDGVWMLEAFPYEFSYPGYTFEKTGYPQDWANVPTSITVSEGYYVDRAYTKNAVVVKQGDVYGIYDFEGNVLYPITLKLEDNAYSDGSGTPISWDPSGNFYLPSTVTDEFTGMVFNSDFKGAEEEDIRAGYGGDPGCYYAIVDGKIAKYDTIVSQWAESFTAPETFGMNFLMEVMENDTVIGTAVVTADGIGKTVPVYPVTDFVNGFYMATDNLTDDIYELSESTKFAYVDAYTGNVITDYIYDRGGFFSCGFAPVRKDGKYGFIDTVGNEVTEFIFDYASYLYEGKAYVSINGHFGILDLAATLEAGIPVTAETCFAGE